MHNLDPLARMLVAFGVVLILLGGLLSLVGRVPYLGRLPGDIHIQRGNFSFYFPLATSLVLSLILSLVLSWFGRR